MAAKYTRECWLAWQDTGAGGAWCAVLAELRAFVRVCGGVLALVF